MKLLRIAVLVLVGAGLAVAQKKDFSGSWEIDQKATDAASPPAVSNSGGRTVRGVTGFPLSIKQTADSFSIERRAGDGGKTVTTTYKLDGVEREVTTSQGKVRARARWQGDTIVIESPNGTTTYSIDAAGLLWVETANPQGATRRAFKRS